MPTHFAVPMAPSPRMIEGQQISKEKGDREGCHGCIIGSWHCGSLTPWSLRDFVSLASVQTNLFNTACSRTLDRDHFLHSWKFGLVHKIIQRVRLRLGN